MMKVLVAGATGVIGRHLIPKLVERGHEVNGMTRSTSRLDTLHEMGATPAVADALDADEVERVAAEVQPDVMVHQLTALKDSLNMRDIDRSFAQTNRLRTEGTDHLLAAGRAIGVQKFVAQSFGGWPFARTRGSIKTEDDVLDPNPLPTMRETHKAIRYLEESVTAATWTEGIVLRYGFLYGPGTSLGPGGEQVELIRKRRFPILGDGNGVWSFIHVEDAADATVTAIERGKPGIYNIVDDQPVTTNEWLPAAAELLGAKPPWRIPLRLGRLLAGDAPAMFMTEMRGASNSKAKHELDWRPRYPSWRDGFAAWVS